MQPYLTQISFISSHFSTKVVPSRRFRRNFARFVGSLKFATRFWESGHRILPNSPFGSKILSLLASRRVPLWLDLPPICSLLVSPAAIIVVSNMKCRRFHWCDCSYRSISALRLINFALFRHKVRMRAPRPLSVVEYLSSVVWFRRLLTNCQWARH